MTATATQTTPSTTGGLYLAMCAAMEAFCEGGEGDRVYAQDHRDEGYAVAERAARMSDEDAWFCIEAATNAAGPFAGPIVYAAAELRLAELRDEYPFIAGEAA